jgi:hypothetical protein
VLQHIFSETSPSTTEVTIHFITILNLVIFLTTPSIVRNIKNTSIVSFSFFRRPLSIRFIKQPCRKFPCPNH